MKYEKLSEENLKRYFEEAAFLQKDLSLEIMYSINKKGIKQLRPAEMPSLLLWGIVLLLFGALSYSISMMETNSFSFNKISNLIDIQVPNLLVDPIMLIASLAIMVNVWVVVIFEKKLLRR
nr:hypothetical protein [Cytophagales bacterium]